MNQAAKWQAHTGFPIFEAPPSISPGEMAAISTGLRVLKGTGTPSDYFGEAMALVKDAASFLRDFGPKQMARHDVVSFTQSPKGYVKFEPVGDGFIVTDLTLLGLLKQVSEPDTKHLKPRTFLGSITKLKYLKEFIHAAGRAQVLSAAEVTEILKTQEMKFDQFLKLLNFQDERNQEKGARK